MKQPIRYIALVLLLFVLATGCNSRKNEGSKKDLQSIFQRFFRSEQVGDIPGTGLGLSIAKELIKLHGGEVWAQSDYGKGSTFSIFLPIIEKRL